MRVAVVGGGIVGLFAAYYLKRDGAEVTIFEREYLGRGSIHAAGLIEPYRFDRINSLGMIAKMLRYMARGITRVRQVDPLWLKALLRTLNRSPPLEAWERVKWMAEFSLKEYRRLAEERNDFDYDESGLYEVSLNERDFEDNLRDCLNSPLKPKCEEAEIKGLGRAVYFPELAKVSTEAFVERMRRELNGVTIAKKEVTDYLSLKGEFDEVVVASGVNVRSLGLPITSFKGYGFRVIGNERVKLPVSVVLNDYGLAIVKNSGYVKLTAGFEADFSRGISEGERVFKLASRAVEVVRVIDGLEGWRPCTHDGFPLVGKFKGLVVATGACRLGWSFAPAMGKMASDLALGREKGFGYISGLNRLGGLAEL
ncbi:MAG: FAD-binding oxidoreductase [Sulfolobales archaeon]|nr:FAD-binding oxidoreductase [Sulfolobales archaeon]